MTITDSNFPLLKILSYDSINTPAQFPLKTHSTDINNNPRTIEKLVENIRYIQSRNTLLGKEQHRNCYIGKDLFQKIDQDQTFREVHFERFISNQIKTCTGAMLFANTGQIVYTIIDNEETRRVKNLDGAYIGIACFEANFFISFEEAIINAAAVKLTDISYYSGGVQPGGMLASVVTFLSYLKTKKELIPLGRNSNTTAEKVYFVD
jgi:hypothetical protein